MVAMFGKFTLASESASLRKRRRAAGSASIPGVSTLTATSRSSCSSRARYTTPIPPAPICSRTRYREMVRPIMWRGEPRHLMASGSQGQRNCMRPRQAGGANGITMRTVGDWDSASLLRLTNVLRREHGADLPRAGGFVREVKGATFTHLAGSPQKGGYRGAVERTAYTDPLDSHCRELRPGQLHALQSHQDINGPVDRTDHCGNMLPGSQAGSIQDVGTRFLKGLEALDRISQVQATVQVVLGASGQRKGKRQTPRFGYRRPHTVHGMRQFVDWLPGIPCRIFDRATNAPRICCQGDGFGNRLGVVAKAVLQIGAYRQMGGRGDLRNVLQNLLTVQGVVQLSSGKSAAHAGCRQRFKAEMREQPRGTDVPRIRNDEGLWLLVERAKELPFFRLTQLLRLFQHCAHPMVEDDSEGPDDLLENSLFTKTEALAPRQAKLHCPCLSDSVAPNRLHRKRGGGRDDGRFRRFSLDGYTSTL